MSKKAAESVFSKSGLTPTDVQVVELHDCFSANELISYEALGLCPPGEKDATHACDAMYYTRLASRILNSAWFQVGGQL